MNEPLDWSKVEFTWDPFMHLPQPPSAFRKYLGLGPHESLPAYVADWYLCDEAT